MKLVHSTLCLHNGERLVGKLSCDKSAGTIPRAANCGATTSAVQGLPAITTVNRFHEHQMLPNFTQYCTSLYSDTPFILRVRTSFTPPFRVLRASLWIRRDAVQCGRYLPWNQSWQKSVALWNCSSGSLGDVYRTTCGHSLQNRSFHIHHCKTLITLLPWRCRLQASSKSC